MATGGSDPKEVGSISHSQLLSAEYRCFKETFERFFCSPAHLMPDLDTVVDWEVTLLLSVIPSSYNQCSLLFLCKLTRQHFVVAPPPALDNPSPAPGHHHDDGCHGNTSRATLTCIPELLWLDLTGEAMREVYRFQELGVVNKAARSIFTAAYVQLTEMTATRSEQTSGQGLMPRISESQRYCQEVARRLKQGKTAYHNVRDKTPSLADGQTKGGRSTKENGFQSKQTMGKTVNVGGNNHLPMSDDGTNGRKSMKEKALLDKQMATAGAEAGAAVPQEVPSSLWVAGGIAALATAGLAWWLTRDKGEESGDNRRRH